MEFTQKRKDKFIAEISKRGIVSHACIAAGINRSTAYDHRRHDPEFARRWEEAIDNAMDNLEGEIYGRACHGREKPVFQGGELVGHVTEYSDVLAMFILKANRPEKYRERYDVSGNMNHTHKDLTEVPTENLSRIRELLTSGNN